MKKLFFLIFIILGFCINAEKFSDYIEVSEPEYVLIYEAGGLYIVNEDNDVLTKVEDGRYKVVDEAQITYLTIKDSVFNGKIYVYDKKNNRIISEYNFKNGVEDGKWIEYDKNEKPASINYIKNGFTIKRETFVNGKLIITKTFKEGIPVNP